jgi:multidrug efflux pump subunit AcrB
VRVPLLFGAPFGFVAQLGVIALGGMITRNSVSLVVATALTLLFAPALYAPWFRVQRGTEVAASATAPAPAVA